MDQFIVDVQDFRWWFNNIIVGIIINIIGGYLVGIRSEPKAGVWTGRGEVNSELLSEHVLLTAHNFQSVIWLLLFMVVFAVLLYIRAYIAFPITGRSPFLSIVLPHVFLILGLLCMWLAYRASSYVTISTRAYTNLRRHLGRE